MIGIVVPVYKRPDYFRQMLDSLKRSDLSDAVVIFVDDGNTEQEMVDLLEEAGKMPKAYVIHMRKNVGVAKSLLEGFDFLMPHCSVLTNIDADMIMHRDWLRKTLDLHFKYPDHIVTGYNCCLEKPVHVDVQAGYAIKTHGVGGANLMFSRNVYRSKVRFAFSYGDGWDSKLNKVCKVKGTKFFVKVPSVMQHIGMESTIRNYKVISTSKDYEHDES